jgi:hypothetical protein
MLTVPDCSLFGLHAAARCSTHRHCRLRKDLYPCSGDIRHVSKEPIQGH